MKLISLWLLIIHFWAHCRYSLYAIMYSMTDKELAESYLKHFLEPVVLHYAVYFTYYPTFDSATSFSAFVIFRDKNINRIRHCFYG